MQTGLIVAPAFEVPNTREDQRLKDPLEPQLAVASCRSMPLPFMSDSIPVTVSAAPFSLASRKTPSKLLPPSVDSPFTAASSITTLELPFIFDSGKLPALFSFSSSSFPRAYRLRGTVIKGHAEMSASAR